MPEIKTYIALVRTNGTDIIRVLHFNSYNNLVEYFEDHKLKVLSAKQIDYNTSYFIIEQTAFEFDE